MTPPVRIGWICLFLAGSASVLRAEPPALAPFPPLRVEVPQPAEEVLHGGATAFVLEDHELPLFTVKIWVRAGSLFEPADRAGLGEIFAEVFRSGGTRGRPPERLNRELELMAASIETGISAEGFTVSLSALSRDFARAMEIFEDVLLNPAFRRKQMELARAGAIESVRRRNDDPGDLAGRTFRKIFYGPDHPRGREPEIRTLRRIRKRDLADFHRRYFHPSRMTVAAAGDLRPEDLRSALNRLLDGFQGSPADLPSFPPIPQPEPGVYLLDRDLSQSQVVMGQLGISRHDPAHFAMEVANRVIGGGGSSRLFGEIRSRRGLAYSIYSFSAERAEVGTAGIVCETKAGSTLEAVRSVRSEVSRLLRDGPAREEVAFAREALVNSFVFQFASPAQIAVTHAQLAYDGFPRDYLQRYTRRLEAVGRSEVNGVIRRYWNPERMTILIVGRAEEFGEPLDSLGPVTKVPFEP